MGLCHSKPPAPKAPADDDDAPLLDAQPPEYSAEVRGPSRQDIIDHDHHDRLLAIATAAATLAAEGGYYTIINGAPTVAARALADRVMAIAMVRGRTDLCVRAGHLPSALPQMRALLLAGDASGKIVDAVLDMLLH